MIAFLRAKAGDSIELAQLAETIWRQHFTPIIGEKQVNYMLTNFQSAKAIANFIDEGYEYYFINVNGINIGYLAIQNRQDHLHLSKFYILKKFRGNGYGKESMKFILSKAKEYKISSLKLVVNKDNADTIAAYEKMGFIKIGAPVTDIGGGFVMDDFEFELRI